MDLSKVTQHDKDEEVRVKTLLELSTKRYNLQKELESLKVRLSARLAELKKLEQTVIALKSEVPVLEKQEEVCKREARDLVRQYVVKSAEVENTQDSVWRRIDTFISDANVKLSLPTKKTHDEDLRKNKEEEWDTKIRRIKLESELEALQFYEKCQSAKMEELKLIRDLLGKDSFVI